MSAHHDITPEQICAAAEQTGMSEIHVRKVMLGLILDEHGVTAALVSAGVDTDFLARLRGVSRLAPTDGREAA